MDPKMVEEFLLPSNRSVRRQDGELLPHSHGSIQGAANVSLLTSMQLINIFLQKAIKGEISVLETSVLDIIHNDTYRTYIEAQLTPKEAEVASLLGLTVQGALESEMQSVDLDRTVSQRDRGIPGMYYADYVGSDLVIRGPRQKPFKGGYTVFPCGNLVYLTHIGNMDDIPGFKCSFAFSVNNSVATLLERIADEIDGQTRGIVRDIGGGGGRGGGGGGGDNGGNGNRKKQKHGDDDGDENRRKCHRGDGDQERKTLPPTGGEGDSPPIIGESDSQKKESSGIYLLLPSCLLQSHEPCP